MGTQGLFKMKSAVIITPTTGDEKLKDAIESVASQTYQNVKHLIVVDGDQFTHPLRANHNALLAKHPNIEIVQLKTNTGFGGYYGHRVFAAFPHLVNEDYVFFLDQDNWFEPNHVETLVAELEKPNVTFAYSLRTIWDSHKNLICKDDCESLGKWPVWNDQNSYHVDTSAYAFNRNFLVQVSHLWHFGYGGDRRFYNLVKQFTHECSGKYTLNYRLDGNTMSASPSFFKAGNEEQYFTYHHEDYPWRK
jgi:GT2 family glycosyltransferase